MNTKTITNLILAFCFAVPIAIVITPIFIYLKKVMYHPFLKKIIRYSNKKRPYS